jgi:hypothetical protein
LAEQVRLSRQEAESIDRAMPERARMLASPRLGLTEQAIAELRSASPTAANRAALGDLLLNSGQSEAARQAYAQPGRSGPDRNTALRNALCDWVQGRIFIAAPPAGSPPTAPAPGAGSPAANARVPTAFPVAEGDLAAAERYYQASRLELIGQYEAALAALRGPEPADEQLARLIGHLRVRLLLSGEGVR